MTSSNPVFDKVVYMTVPVTFEYVQVLLVTKDNKALCGLRFRAQHGHSDGCLGLRRARATETKDTCGYYEALTCGAYSSPRQRQTVAAAAAYVYYRSATTVSAAVSQSLLSRVLFAGAFAGGWLAGASPKKQPKGQTVTEELSTVAEGKTRCKAGPLIEGPFSLHVRLLVERYCYR